MAGQPIRKGDRIAVWKRARLDSPRTGVVWVGEVATNRVGSLAQVLVRYVRAPLLPIWASPAHMSVVDEFGERFSGQDSRPMYVQKVTADQWQRLIIEAGGWPETTSGDVTDRDVECYACGRIIVGSQPRVEDQLHAFHKRCAVQVHGIVSGGLPSLGNGR